MIVLTNPGTADTIEAITSSGADVDFDVEFTEQAEPYTPSSNTSLKNTPTNRTTAGTFTICAGPASNSFTRNVKGIHGRNIDGATSNDVTVQKNCNGGTIITLKKVTLLPGESFTIDDKGVFWHFDASGHPYSQGAPVATQADMEAGTSTQVFTTPGRQHYHPAHTKAFVSCGVAADIQQSFGVSSLTDNGTGDLTVNFSTSFAAATYYAQVNVEMTTTTYAVSAMRNPHIRSGGRATGSCRFDCVDQTSATSLIKDPTTWHCDFKGDQ